MAGGKYDNRALGECDAVEVGTAAGVEDLEELHVMVYGTFVGTYDLEVSMDGTNFVQHPTHNGLTAPAILAVGMPCKSVRLNCTAFTSGTISAEAAGKDVDRLG